VVHLNIATDLSPIGLIRNKDYGGYFCTPKSAVVFANLGVDGIHFCILPDEKDLTLENSPVYVVSPMTPDHYVEVVAENFNDFLSLVVSVKDAGALECISFVEKEGFLEHLQDIPQGNPEVEKAITALSKSFSVKSIVDVYDYVKQTQAKTDFTKIQYTDEYYELIG